MLLAREIVLKAQTPRQICPIVCEIGKQIEDDNEEKAKKRRTVPYASLRLRASHGHEMLATAKGPVKPMVLKFHIPVSFYVGLTHDNYQETFHKLL